MNEHANTVHGLPPLTARREPWMNDLLGDPAGCAALIDEYGSPVNLIDPQALNRNAQELITAAADAGVAAKVFFARKANKALALVDAAHAHGHGIDVSSQRELAQVLDRGVPPNDIIVTAALKPRRLLELCAARQVPLSLDNLDEAAAWHHVSAGHGPVVLRLAPAPSEQIAPTRFGLSADAWLNWVQAVRPEHIAGVHFHLHGYAAAARAEALRQALAFIDELTQLGYRPSFIDMGGGVPMSYLESHDEWAMFWASLCNALETGKEITWRGDGLGLRREGIEIVGDPAVYPYYQSPVRGQWLSQVLNEPAQPGHEETLAEALGSRDLALHLEPGRAILDGCGVTLARVEFRKTTSDGVNLVGLAMNRTQCRTTSADFLVDPVLIRPPQAGQASEPVDAYLVGAYCIEAELILRRKLRFPTGVAVGDVIMLPNTAGYFMHIVESASHQIPLATNVTVRAPKQADVVIAGNGSGPGEGVSAGGQGWVVDDIDRSR